LGKIKIAGKLLIHKFVSIFSAPPLSQEKILVVVPMLRTDAIMMLC
jgi:hypothetical protein